MNKTNLRQLKRNLHGVSVVIGALMLTLIVVTAAASFAIFTAQKQEELQKQEFAQLLREQEELSVNKIVDLTYDSDGNLSTISFSIANQHTRSSKIVALKINDHVISDFHVTDQTDQQTTGWTLKGKYYRTAYFANDTYDNLYVFDDLNGNHKVDSEEEILDNNPDGGDEANPESGNQGYLYAKDSDGEPYLFNDTDFDGVYTTEIDFIVDCNGKKNMSRGAGSPDQNVTGAEVLSSFSEEDHVFSNKSSKDTEVVWIENGTNTWYNTTINEDILLLNLTGSAVGNWTGAINTTGTNVFSWSEWKYFDFDNSGDYTLGEDIVIDFNNQSTFSAEKEYNFSLDIDDNEVNANPMSGDRGGIYPKFDDFKIDSMGQYIISIENADNDIIYFGEKLKQNDALTIEVQTDLTNTFEKSFIPPTANIKVKEEDDSIVLDGTSSFSHNYSNIVKWEWELTNTLTDKTLPLKYGRKVNANRILVDDEGVKDYINSYVDWIINLTVTDDFGMIGTDTFNHTQDFKPLMTENENLEIVDFRVNYSNEKIDYVNFSIKNNYEFDSNITNLFINNIDCEGNFTEDMSVKNYSINKQSDLDNVTFSKSDQITMENPVTIKFKTALGNTFEKTFYPPNPIATLSMQPSYNGQSYEDNIKLDATDSQAITENSYLVNYSWNVNYTFYYIDINGNNTYDSSDDYRIQSKTELNWEASWDDDHNGDTGNNVSFLWEDLDEDDHCDSNEVKKVINGTFADRSNITMNGNYSSSSEYRNEKFMGSTTILSPIISIEVNKIILNIKDNHGMKSIKQVYP